MGKTNNKFQVRKTNLVLGLLSILNGLFINVVYSSQVLAQKTSFKSSQQLVAQTLPNWSRISLNDSASIMLPGSWEYDEDVIYSSYNQAYYMARYYIPEPLDFKISDTQTVGFCNVINCKTYMTLMINEICKEENWALDTLNPISVIWQGHPVEAIEFSTNDLNGVAKMKGRIIIAGNIIYFLAAATDGNYFDNNVDIFLNSFSQ